jgi:hypothetical protein
MSLQAFERPSIAKEFFLKITGDSDPVAAIKRLVGATPPVFETEWLDFKGAAQINDAGIKKTWSEALAGFANTQGGILIWGVDARKDQATGIDAAYGLSLVKSPPAFKSRLNELHHQATEPPVLEVEIEAFSIAGTDDGFVVCYIPESPFKPHRAEHAARQYFIRAGDDFVVPSVSLLRNLFFPQSRCLLVPILRASCIVENQCTSYRIMGFLHNAGSATAFDTFVIIYPAPVGQPYSSIPDWIPSSTYDPYSSSAKTPIHPGIKMQFFGMIYSPQYNPPSFAKGLEFKIQVFARDAEPVEWLISFTEDEVKTGIEKRGKHRSLFF